MTTQIIDVAREIDARKISGLQWRVFILCGLVALCDGFDTQSIAFAAPSIASDWGVPVSDFGLVFASGLLGLTVAALSLGALGDRIGRKRIIILSLLAMGVFSIWAAYARSMEELTLARFCVGLGLGGAIPSVIALTAEYSPLRLRSTLVTSMFIGFPLGAVLGGLVSARLIAEFGWTSVFWAGGILPLILIPVVLAALPESIGFLAAAGRHRDRIAAVLNRIAPDIRIGEGTTFTTPGQGTARGSIGQLFTPDRALTTLTLWGIFFCNLLVMYLLINWLPVVLSQAGLPIERAILGTVLLNLGGAVGGFVIARTMDRWGGTRVFLAAYVGAAVFVVAVGYAVFDVRLLMALIFLTGACLIGAQFGMNALAAAYYPTEIRSTGVGWALGIGRVGSIVGPVVGGAAIALGADARAVLTTAALPTLACLLGMMLLGLIRSRTKTNTIANLEKAPS
ncbi:MAG: MFS transporter [Brevundimonas sp.]|uniref:MFS transporter n=1 Tax=Brevundimonas sp. TaxID=1871086 RepID=UPI000DBBB6EC|nr:MFS transporter [Brevundimonas sp.]PZU60439.1 MAG: MFS transporter [Brevundimonas sp.]